MSRLNRARLGNAFIVAFLALLVLFMIFFPILQARSARSNPVQNLTYEESLDGFDVIVNARNGTSRAHDVHVWGLSTLAQDFVDIDVRAYSQEIYVCDKVASSVRSIDPDQRARYSREDFLTNDNGFLDLEISYYAPNCGQR